MQYVVSWPLPLFTLLLVPRKSFYFLTLASLTPPRSQASTKSLPQKPAQCQPCRGHILDAPLVKWVKTPCRLRVWPMVLTKINSSFFKNKVMTTRILLICKYKLWPKIWNKICAFWTLYKTETGRWRKEPGRASWSWLPLWALSFARWVRLNSI